jgi:hypothetical protein
MKNKETDEHARTGDNCSILTLGNKLPFIVIARFCANILAIFYLKVLLLEIIQDRT